MLRGISSLPDVVDWGMCIGCGACYAVCDKSAVTLVNIQSIGIRPIFDHGTCTSCNRCLSFCPGYSVDGSLEIGRPPRSEAEREFGPALEIWEGHAVDPEIRFRASSGGLLTALSLYCLEREGMDFVLHTGMDKNKPWLNRTVQSRTREDLLSCTGSRYAPASPCDSLRAIETSDRPCVFVGKPCDTAAVSKLRRERPGLDRNLGLVLTFFCAGAPNTRGTLDLLESLDVSPDDVEALRYRGEGWPGRFRVQLKTSQNAKSFSYMESWGRLTKYRTLRCHLCPDGLGTVADMSCGDAWERFRDDGDPGQSIVLVRTERGRRILNGARAAGYVALKPIAANAVLAAQQNLLRRRRDLYGRLLAMRLLLVPTPKFLGFSLFRSWIRQTPWRQARTLMGTARRVLLRGLWRRQTIVPTSAALSAVAAPTTCSSASNSGS
jgi:coenzyme F420 hydrogenase subunit beta